MIRRFPHILRENRGGDFPQYFIFFDTETRNVDFDNNARELQLRLGVAKFCRRRANGTLNVVDEITFTTRAQFHEWVESKIQKGRRTFMVAHNIGFDIQVLDVLGYLRAHKWKRVMTFLDYSITLFKYRRRKASLVLFDNMNIFKVRLEELGHNIGLEKLNVDFEDATEDKLRVYCTRDVDIMIRAWEQWFAFLREHDAGNFAYSLAGQSFNAYRHRFMNERIFIHNNERALALERAAYHGGRCEAFFIGTLKPASYYKLDVNSMYPAVMRNYTFPVRLISHRTTVIKDEFQFAYEHYGIIARVKVDTPHPFFPKDIKGQLCFPLGRFETTICKPEIELLYRYKIPFTVVEYAIYEEKAPFKDFVDYYYNLRMQYRKEGNTTFEYLSKVLLNSLFGKFGQKKDKWVMAKGFSGEKDGIQEYFDVDTGQLIKLRIIGGRAERSAGKVEGQNSFPAISAYITSYARAMLIDIMSTAEWKNVAYCDTDSIITNAAGRLNCANFIDNTRLGFLKIEQQGEQLSIRGLKDYIFNGKETIKGVKRDAIFIKEDEVIQDKFRGLKGALADGDTSHQLVYREKKVLARQYAKGSVDAQGIVHPLVLQDF